MADPKRTRLLKAAKRWGNAKHAHVEAHSARNFDILKATETAGELRRAEKALLAAVDALDG